MNSDIAKTCPDCGAVACHDKYGQMLALEFEDPAVFGAVHHITVTCYNLQHPGAFTDEAVAWMQTSLRAVVVDGLSATQLREQVRKKAKQGLKVKRHAEPMAEPARARWSMTVADIRTENPTAYREDVMAWAKSILKDLDID